MPEVLKLGIASKNNQSIDEVNSIEVLANKGVVGDRHFKEFNDPYNQISLIESENIDYYNNKYSLDIPYINFRRNVITKGIQLNDLVSKKFVVGNVELEGIDLCRPCRHLTEILNQDNILKEFLRKGGLRCQILSSSTIKVGDRIILS
ncbi:MOSC domain-containing protein [Candidatus Pelagibacter sp.]|nr:MOSC domain-containing protein [Candidatus Pelagibacter sp.]|tara:strand:- start:480 stop:923 length:444 start_codon:yes stop_codon:yes gene_type:complete